MKNLRLIIPVVCFTLIQTACAILPRNQSTNDPKMETQVVQILTAMVTEVTPTNEAATHDLLTSTPYLSQTIIETPTAKPPSQEIGLIATSSPVPEQTLETELTIIPTEILQLSPTLLVSSTPTAYPGDPVTILGSPTWKDALDSGDNWPLGSDEFLNLEAYNGTLKMTGLVMQNGWRLASQKAVNFYLETKAAMPACNGTDHYGLIFRVPSLTEADQGYLFGISCEGKYALRKWDGEKMSVLKNWTEDSIILKGQNQINRLGVMVNGHEIKMYVNGKLVDTLIDNSYSQGYFGLYIGPKMTTNLVVNFDEISFYLLP